MMPMRPVGAIKKGQAVLQPSIVLVVDTSKTFLSILGRKLIRPQSLRLFLSDVRVSAPDETYAAAALESLGHAGAVKSSTLMHRLIWWRVSDFSGLAFSSLGAISDNVFMSTVPLKLASSSQLRFSLGS